jgi:hypothetical protein
MSHGNCIELAWSVEIDKQNLEIRNGCHQIKDFIILLNEMPKFQIN